MTRSIGRMRWRNLASYRHNRTEMAYPSRGSCVRSGRQQLGTVTNMNQDRDHEKKSAGMSDAIVEDDHAMKDDEDGLDEVKMYDVVVVVG